MPPSDVERLERVAYAYDVVPSDDSVAQAIINRTKMTASANDRQAVIALVDLIVGSADTFAALETGESLPDAVWKQMQTTVAECSPPLVIPAWSLIDIVLSDLRFVLFRPQ